MHRFSPELNISHRIGSASISMYICVYNKNKLRSGASLKTQIGKTARRYKEFSGIAEVGAGSIWKIWGDFYSHVFLKKSLEFRQQLLAA
jgi:hypothetical protein